MWLQHVRRVRWIALATLVVALAACGDGEPASSPSPSPAPGAVYLSIGDSIQYGCCGDPQRSASPLFRDYLGTRLVRPVEWLTTANNDTAREFINGTGTGEPQLVRAVSLIEALRAEGRPIVAITMSIGGNDYVEVGETCSQPPCTELFLQILERMKGDLERIYEEIGSVIPAGTPLMVVAYYNASDCGQPGVETSPTELGQRAWNATISEIAKRHGAFIVDAYTPFKGRACELIEGVDPNYDGYVVLADAYRATYEALPRQYVDSFVVGAEMTPTATP